MAKAPPPEPIDHHYDIRRLTKVFAITSILVLPAFAWMTWQDYGRDWKSWQKKFVENDRKRTRAALRAASEKIDPEVEEKYPRAEARGRARAAPQPHGRLGGRRPDEEGRGRLVRRRPGLPLQEGRDGHGALRLRDPPQETPEGRVHRMRPKGVREPQAAYESSTVVEQAAHAAWDDAKAELAALEKTKRDAEEALAKLDADYDRFQAKIRTLRQNDAFYFVRNAPIADMLAPSLKIQQVQLDGLYNDVNFLRSQRVDRCVTCHIAAETRGFEDKEKYPQSVLRTHPRLDLFVDSNSPHPYATFGCTSCHGGRDRATDFTRAGHMPNDYGRYEQLAEQLESGRDDKGLPTDDDVVKEAMDETQTGRWMKEYDWEVDKFNDLPMYPMKAVEAGCFRCHRTDAGHPKAAKLDQGRKLVEQLGCWSCHKMKGLEDLPRIGPNLFRVASKTTPEWTERWLVNPRAFRNNTKMPRFFYLENFEGEAGHKLTDTMVAGRHGLSLREVGEGVVAGGREGRRGARPAALRERGLPGLPRLRGGRRAARDGRLAPARPEPDRALPEGDAGVARGLAEEPEGLQPRDADAEPAPRGRRDRRPRGVPHGRGRRSPSSRAAGRRRPTRRSATRSSSTTSRRRSPSWRRRPTSRR